jgi:cytoplasmic iron level regulating protein YaaA (DUF328/UPF0246 family)
MLILLSPSKTINFKQFDKTISFSRPQFLESSKVLVAAVNKLGPKLPKIFGVSQKIAEDNEKQFKTWNSEAVPPKACPAAWAYRGETFAGLSIEKLNTNSIKFAQDHLLIISGLYGLLRPLDLIVPYRLEMTTVLEGSWGKNLYQFWGDKLTNYIEAQKPSFILNCASDAYFDVIGRNLSKSVQIITPKFLHNDIQKMAFSKYSRGLMASWAITERMNNPQDVTKFNEEGYTYDSKKSTPNIPVFIAPKKFSIAGRWKKTNTE